MPDPADYDNESDFVSACISQRQDEHPDEDVDQSTAICYSMWSDKSMSTRDNSVIRKVHASDESMGLEFILSDATPDRYDDVIEPDGWVLDNFKKNPIALFNHDSDFPIGRWERLGVKDGELRGHLRMAPEGISPRIDEIRRLIEAGILRATSVGFRPLEYEDIPKSSGYRYTKCDLVETSLVSVPANPNALAVAKRLGVSDSISKMVFVKHDNKNTIIKPKVFEQSTTWNGQTITEKYYPTKF